MMKRTSFFAALLLTAAFSVWHFFQTLELVNPVTINLESSPEDEAFNVTITNNSKYDLTVYFPHRFFHGEIIASFDGVTLARFVDDNAQENLMTSVVEELPFRISSARSAKIKIKLSDILYIGSCGSHHQDNMKAWLELRGLPVLVHSIPKVRLETSVFSDKINLEHVIGNKLKLATSKKR